MPESGYVRYSYYIFRDGHPIRAEWNSLPRTLYLSGNSKKTYRIQDCWKNLPEQQYFYTSAFTESLLAHRERSAAPKGHKKGLLIKAYAPASTVTTVWASAETSRSSETGIRTRPYL